MPKIVFLLFLLFQLVSFSAFAEKKFSFNTDSSSIDVRNFDQSALNEYKADKDFNYGEIRGDFSPSLWDQFWNWFWGLFRGTISNAKADGVFKYVFIILGCIAVIFILVKLAGMDHAFLFTGKSKELEIDYSENLENIHDIRFDDEINKALQNNDFRLAVRLLYLKLLKGLSDSGRIQWQPDKTNAAYIDELKNLSQKEKFKLLTHRFEYVWYGSFPVDREAYQKISHSFNEFNFIGR